MSLLQLLACGGPAVLSPTLDVESDALLSTLPSDVTLVAGGDLAALRDAPLARALVSRALLDPDALEASALATGVEAWSGVRVGCGGAGCVAVGPGRLRRSELETVASTRGLDVDDDGERAILSAGGVPFAAEARGPFLLAGDLPAVEAFGRDALASASFRDAIPDGDVWIGARDASTFLAQAADRLDAEGSDEGARLATRLRDASDSSVAGLARTIGLSLTAGKAMSAVLRVQCVDVMAAREVGWMMDAALLRARLAAPEEVDEVLADVAIVRVGDVVEARVSGTAEGWADVLALRAEASR